MVGVIRQNENYQPTISNLTDYYTYQENIIGNVNKKAEVHGLEEAYKYPEVKIHIYGKEECRVGRKMGHITVTDKTIEDALFKARYAHSKIKF